MMPSSLDSSVRTALNGFMRYKPRLPRYGIICRGLRLSSPQICRNLFPPGGATRSASPLSGCSRGLRPSCRTLSGISCCRGITPLSEIETEVGIKYEGYINRQLKEIGRHKELEHIKIPSGLDFADVQGLSNELKCRLSEIRPVTLGQASLIEGMTPAGLQAIQLSIRMFEG